MKKIADNFPSTSSFLALVIILDLYFTSTHIFSGLVKNFEFLNRMFALVLFVMLMHHIYVVKCISNAQNVFIFLNLIKPRTF